MEEDLPVPCSEYERLLVEGLQRLYADPATNGRQGTVTQIVLAYRGQPDRLIEDLSLKYGAATLRRADLPRPPADDPSPWSTDDVVPVDGHGPGYSEPPTMREAHDFPPHRNDTPAPEPAKAAYASPSAAFSRPAPPDSGAAYRADLPSAAAPSESPAPDRPRTPEPLATPSGPPPKPGGVRVDWSAAPAPRGGSDGGSDYFPPPSERGPGDRPSPSAAFGPPGAAFNRAVPDPFLPGDVPLMDGRESASNGAFGRDERTPMAWPAATPGRRDEPLRDEHSATRYRPGAEVFLGGDHGAASRSVQRLMNRRGPLSREQQHDPRQGEWRRDVSPSGATGDMLHRANAEAVSRVTYNGPADADSYAAYTRMLRQEQQREQRRDPSPPRAPPYRDAWAADHRPTSGLFATPGGTPAAAPTGPGFADRAASYGPGTGPSPGPGGVSPTPGKLLSFSAWAPPAAASSRAASATGSHRTGEPLTPLQPQSRGAYGATRTAATAEEDALLRLAIVARGRGETLAKCDGCGAVAIFPPPHGGRHGFTLVRGPRPGAACAASCSDAESIRGRPMPSRTPSEVSLTPITRPVMGPGGRQMLEALPGGYEAVAPDPPASGGFRYARPVPQSAAAPDYRARGYSGLPTEAARPMPDEALDAAPEGQRASPVKRLLSWLLQPATSSADSAQGPPSVSHGEVPAPALLPAEPEPKPQRDEAVPAVHQTPHASADQEVTPGNSADGVRALNVPADDESVDNASPEGHRPVAGAVDLAAPSAPTKRPGDGPGPSAAASAESAPPVKMTPLVQEEDASPPKPVLVAPVVAADPAAEEGPGPVVGVPEPEPSPDQSPSRSFARVATQPAPPLVSEPGPTDSSLSSPSDPRPPTPPATAPPPPVVVPVVVAAPAPEARAAPPLPSPVGAAVADPGPAHPEPSPPPVAQAPVVGGEDSPARSQPRTPPQPLDDDMDAPSPAPPSAPLPPSTPLPGARRRSILHDRVAAGDDGHGPPTGSRRQGGASPGVTFSGLEAPLGTVASDQSPRRADLLEEEASPTRPPPSLGPGPPRESSVAVRDVDDA